MKYLSIILVMVGCSQENVTPVKPVELPMQIRVSANAVGSFNIEVETDSLRRVERFTSNATTNGAVTLPIKKGQSWNAAVTSSKEINIGMTVEIIISSTRKPVEKYQRKCNSSLICELNGTYK